MRALRRTRLAIGLPVAALVLVGVFASRAHAADGPKYQGPSVKANVTPN